MEVGKDSFEANFQEDSRHWHGPIHIPEEMLSSHLNTCAGESFEEGTEQGTSDVPLLPTSLPAALTLADFSLENFGIYPNPTDAWDDMIFSPADDACEPIGRNANLGRTLYFDNPSSQRVEPITTAEDNGCEALEFPGSELVLLHATGGDFDSQCEGFSSTKNIDEYDVTGRSSREKTPLASANPSQSKSVHLARRNPNYKANSDYTPLTTKPRPWRIFNYTIHGELNPNDLFTAEELKCYLWNHRLHALSRDRRTSHLILRIHRTPPSSKARYPTNHGSHRCRFFECPADNNTIDKGQIVVMFDEQSSSNADHDPYLNAGYVHLYCMERFLDFPRICADLNVQVEKRTLEKETKNLMRLSPGEVEEEAEKFIKSCRQLRFQGYSSSRNAITGQPYDGTLNHRLHVAKLKSRPRGINRQEAARESAAGPAGSSSIGLHLGDLVLANALRKETRKHAKQNQLIANPRQSRRYKGDGVEEEEDEVENGDEEQIRKGGDDRIKLLRRPLHPLITSGPHMTLSTSKHTEDESLNGGPSKPIPPLDENRRLMLPTTDRPMLAQTAHQQIHYSHKDHQSKVTQPQATSPTSASPADHPIPKANTNGQGRQRSSDEACNDDRGDSDAVNRPVKKTRHNFDTSIPQHLYMQQSHHGQAPQMQATSRPFPPLPTMHQASLPHPQMVIPPFQRFPTQEPWAGKKRTADDADFKDTPNHPGYPGPPAATTNTTLQDCRQPKRMKETYSSAVSYTQPNMLPPQHFGMQNQPGTMMISAPNHPLQQQPHLRYRPMHGPPQHFPQNPHESFHPGQRSLNAYHQQRNPAHPRPPATYQLPPQQTPEELRKVHEEYQKYVRQSRSRRPSCTPTPTPKPKRIRKPKPKPRKQKNPPRIRGSDGKIIKIKRKTGKFREKSPEQSPQEHWRQQRELLKESERKFRDLEGEEMSEDELLAAEERAMRLIQEKDEAEREAVRGENLVEALREAQKELETAAEEEEAEEQVGEGEEEHEHEQEQGEQKLHQDAKQETEVNPPDKQAAKKQEDPAETARRIRALNEQCLSEWTYKDDEEIVEWKW